MFNNISVFTAGFIVFILIMLGVGFLLSASMSDTDLVNFLRNGAEAEQTKADTQWETTLRQMELPYVAAEREAWSKVDLAEAEQAAALTKAETEQRVKLANAQAEADAARIQEAIRFEKEQNDQKLAREAQWMEILLGAVKVFVFVVIASFGYFLLRAVHGFTGTYLARTQKRTYPGSTDVWENNDYKEREILRARQLEQVNRKRMVELSKTRVSAPIKGNDKFPGENM